MKNTIKSRFEDIAETIEGTAIVVFALLFFIVALIFKNQAFVYRVLPEDMSMRMAASWILPIGYQLIVLITTANTHLIGRWLPPVLAVLNGLMILFFIGAFEPNSTLVTAQRFFIGITASMIEYTLALLFVKKRREHQAIQDLEELEKAKLLKLELVKAKTQEAENLNKYILSMQAKLKELTCPHCQFEALNHKSLNAHLGRCKQKPSEK